MVVKVVRVVDVILAGLPVFFPKVEKPAKRENHPIPQSFEGEDLVLATLRIKEFGYNFVWFVDSMTSKPMITFPGHLELKSA